jgi:hypothetical protein
VPARLTAGRIAIAGAVAQKPGCAGHVWQFLQYLLGFRSLGYEVLLLDRLDGPLQPRDRRVRWLRDTLADAGLDGAWSLRLEDGRHLGVAREDAVAFVRDAEVLLDVMGFCGDDELLGAARRTVFLDTDPGFAQMWQDLGLADVLGHHDVHMTIGERIGAPDCSVPTCGLRWVTTPQPVALDAWPVSPGGGRGFTSVASWRGAYGPVDHGGRRYGLRVHQFRRFAQLPRLAGGGFELALDIHSADVADAQLLRAGGWQLVEPASVAATPGAYRRYVQASDGEVMVAKGMYVDSRSGWVSERSLCYLASGRPVVAQDTGFSERYPVGEGLLAFSTPEEAAAGVEAVRADPQRHRRAARELAEERFGAERVLGRLLAEVTA